MGRRDYTIPFGGLPVGEHQFELEVSDSFFEEKEISEVAHGKIKVEVTLIKSNTLLKVRIAMDGEVELNCDRCLTSYSYPLSGEETLVVKQGADASTDDEYIILPAGETSIDVAQTLYEMISVAIPSRKVPCEEDEEFVCDQETLQKLEDISLEEEPKPQEDEDKNPLWAELKKISFNN